MKKDVKFSWYQWNEFDSYEPNKGYRREITITDVPGKDFNEIFCNADNQFAYMYPEVDSATVSQEIL